jgi:hypothetical protein
MKKMIMLLMVLVIVPTIALGQRYVKNSDFKADSIYRAAQEQKIRDTTAVKLNRSELAMVYGVATISVGDSLQISISGLTTAAQAIVCYQTEGTATPDTAATWSAHATGKLTLRGKNGYTISYWVWKK